MQRSLFFFKRSLQIGRLVSEGAERSHGDERPMIILISIVSPVSFVVMNAGAFVGRHGAMKPDGRECGAACRPHRLPDRSRVSELLGLRCLVTQ